MPLWGVNHLSTFDAELRNVSFALISFMEFPAILSALQPFQICIYNRQYSKLIFSNGSQLMGKRFLANLHASLESTCKTRISKISIRCQNWRGGQSSLTMSRLNLNWKPLGDILVSQMWGQSSFKFWCWTQKCKFCIDIFYGVSCNIMHITAISNLHLQ